MRSESEAGAVGSGLVVGLLGPVEVLSPAGGLAGVAQPMLRVLLAMLAVAAGRVVSDEALVDGLWGEEWSRERAGNLQGHVAAFRRLLARAEPYRAGSRVVRSGGGYRLVLGPGELDVGVFQELAQRGRELLRAGRVEQARDLFAQTLALWRGPALADVLPLCPRLAGDAVGLEEQRAGVLEERIECDLALGGHAEVAGELAQLVARFPLRERSAAQLMVALYRCGRRGEALAAFDRTRRVLAEELGLDPGPALADVQRQILADDAVLAAPAFSVAAGSLSGGGGSGDAGREMVPRQLPAGSGFFAGRQAELKELDGLLSQVGLGGEEGDREAARPVVISAVGGMAGVGKTALAVYWARKVAGRFPDGQLYVNLRGYDAGAAVTADEAVGWFLAALGVPAAQIPVGAAARTGLYRSVLAKRRVLIVLDNARDPSQVRPLLPGSPGCLVLVTSRSGMTGLVASEGARPLRLGALDADQAAVLLAGRLGPERIAAESDAAGELSRLCGGLPLALAIVAAQAAAAPGLPLEVLATQLASAQHAETARLGPAGPGRAARLDLLETGDAATSLRDLLSWSVGQLSDPAATMFALLGMHCGPDITLPAAASLAGVPRADAGRALAELADASLATEHRPGRYLLHDLVRSYAAEHARRALGDALIHEAVCRSLNHYLHSLAAAPDNYFAQGFKTPIAAPGVVAELLPHEGDLLNWMSAEQGVLLSAIAQAAAVGLDTHAWQIFAPMTIMFAARGQWADWSSTGQIVLATATRAADPTGLGWTKYCVGMSFLNRRALDDALGYLGEALRHFEHARDVIGQAQAHFCISQSLEMQRDPHKGLGHAEQALALFREIGDRTGEASAIASLGSHHAYLGNHELASDYCRQSIELHRKNGDAYGEFDAWDSLGHVHHAAGDYGSAIESFSAALRLPTNPETYWRRGRVLTLLGDAYMAVDDLAAARASWQQAVQILEDKHHVDAGAVRARLQSGNTDHHAKAAQFRRPP